jgi:4-hydroxythreonine-4-phosphate dehydrogenase
MDDVRDGRLNLITCFDEEVKVELGTRSDEAVTAGKKALARALEDMKKGCFDALLLAPLSANADLQKEGLLVLMSNQLRVAIATNNMALKDVTTHVTTEKVTAKAELLLNMLKRDLRISNPRVAVLSLNPDADGPEERDVLAPAVAKLATQSKQAFGPYAADDFFGTGKYNAFDAVLAMYHDQGQTPFKALVPENGVRFTTGLSMVRTAPAHGTYFNIAGRNQAEAQSMRQAIYTAIDIWRNRQNYDEPTANPLPKLYHEKRDDSEKVRFRSNEGAPRFGKDKEKKQADTEE